MTETEETPFGISKLNDSNYHMWKPRLENYLKLEDLWDIITETPPEKSETRDDSYWFFRDYKTQSIIKKLIEKNQNWRIMSAKSAKEMWESLKDYYEKPCVSTATVIWRELRGFHLEENGDMMKHTGRLMELFSRLETMGQGLPESLKMTILLDSLPGSYEEYVRVQRDHSKEDETFNSMNTKLRWEFRRRENDAKLRNECTFCGRQGHVREKCFKFLRSLEKKNDS